VKVFVKDSGNPADYIITMKVLKNITMTLDEAVEFLRSVGEYDIVLKADRESVIGWAEFLKKREGDKKTKTTKSSK